MPPAPHHSPITPGRKTAGKPRPLRLWVINQYAAQFPGPGLTRHHFLAGAMRQQDVTTTIVADKPELRGDADRSPRVEDAEGTRFVWLRTPAYQGNGLRRVVNMFDFVRGAIRWGWRRREDGPDVVLGSSPQLFAALAGWILAKRHRVPFVLEVRDLWPESFVAILGLPRRHPLVIVLGVIEKFLYRRSDRIVGVLSGVGDYVRMRVGDRGAPVTWIPNGVPLATWPPATPVPDDGDEFRVVYAGSHGPPNGMMTLLQAAEWLQQHPDPASRPIRFDLYGGGVQKQQLIAYAGKHSLDAVHFHDPVPRTAVIDILAGADALTAVLPSLYLYRFGTSLNKMFDYLAAGRPIVMATDEPDNIVDRSRAGVTASTGSPEEFARALRRVAGMTADERQQMGDAGVAYVREHHDMAVLGATLADVLRQAVAGR